MSKRKPLLWIYEALLVIGFLRGLYMFGEPDIPRIAICVGLAFNLLLQYGIIKAIRRKPIDQLPPAEQVIAKTRKKEVLNTVFTGAAALAVVMLINVGLFVKQVYSARAFAFVQLVAVALFFCYFVASFRRLQKKTGIGISNGS
jgi:ABC-type bacteriocin/lantibiotic exporter with double-glycine peptidase domain